MNLTNATSLTNVSALFTSAVVKKTSGFVFNILLFFSKIPVRVMFIATITVNVVSLLLEFL